MKTWFQFKPLLSQILQLVALRRGRGGTEVPVEVRREQQAAGRPHVAQAGGQGGHRRQGGGLYKLNPVYPQLGSACVFGEACLEPSRNALRAQAPGLNP
jgi:hypothetical protein